METAMELDELKSAWAALDRHLQQQTALNTHLFRERKLDKVSKGMRRLYWGKIAQILFGDALIYFGIVSTMRYLGNMPLLICSVFMLLYGVLIVVFGGVSLARISRIDYAAPVLDIQKRVGTLHRAHITANLWAGLPWWFLWIAIFALEMKANVGVDLFVSSPAFISVSAAIGVIGFVTTLWFYRRPRAAETQDYATVPRGLRDAGAALDEIARFERS